MHQDEFCNSVFTNLKPNLGVIPNLITAHTKKSTELELTFSLKQMVCQRLWVKLELEMQ